MAALCQPIDPAAPFIAASLSNADCNVQSLVHGAYNAIFPASGALSFALTGLLTLFIALFGYRLMLGRAQLRISDLTITAVKLGAVVVLTTQWPTYQALVYNFLFAAPAELGDAILGALRPSGIAFGGSSLTALQQVFDGMQALAAGYANQAPATTSPLLGGPGFGAMALTFASGILLLSTIGVMLAAKIVLGVLIAIGPIFIALLLFDSTRGLFEGWLRASIAFALAPLAATLVIAASLALLTPPLLQIAQLQTQNQYPLGPVYAVFIGSIVVGMVAIGIGIAGGMIAAGFGLPASHSASYAGSMSADLSVAAASEPSRAARVAAAMAATNRDNLHSTGGDDRRAPMASTRAREELRDVRLGTANPRRSAPRSAGIRTRRGR